MLCKLYMATQPPIGANSEDASFNHKCRLLWCLVCEGGLHEALLNTNTQSERPPAHMAWLSNNFVCSYPDSWFEAITSNTKFYSLAAIFDTRIIGIIVSEVKRRFKCNREVSKTVWHFIFHYEAWQPDLSFLYLCVRNRIQAETYFTLFICKCIFRYQPNYTWEGNHANRHREKGTWSYSCRVWFSSIPHQISINFMRVYTNYCYVKRCN